MHSIIQYHCKCISMHFAFPIDPSNGNHVIAIFCTCQLINVVVSAMLIIIHWDQYCQVEGFAPFLCMPDLCDWSIWYFGVKVEVRTDKRVWKSLEPDQFLGKKAIVKNLTWATKDHWRKIYCPDKDLCCVDRMLHSLFSFFCSFCRASNEGTSRAPPLQSTHKNTFINELEIWSHGMLSSVSSRNICDMA